MSSVFSPINPPSDDESASGEPAPHPADPDENPPSPYIAEPAHRPASPLPPPTPVEKYTMPESVVQTLRFEVGPEMVPLLLRLADDADDIPTIPLPLSTAMALEFSEVHWRACLPHITLRADWLELKEWCLGALVADNSHQVSFGPASEFHLDADGEKEASPRVAARTFCFRIAQLAARQQHSARYAQRCLQELHTMFESHSADVKQQMAEVLDKAGKDSWGHASLLWGAHSRLSEELTAELDKLKIANAELEAKVAELSTLKQSHEELRQQVVNMERHFSGLTNTMGGEIAKLAHRNTQRDIAIANEHLAVGGFEVTAPPALIELGDDQPAGRESAHRIASLPTRDVFARLRAMDFNYLPPQNPANTAYYELGAPLEGVFRNILIQIMGYTPAAGYITPTAMAAAVNLHQTAAAQAGTLTYPQLPTQSQE